MGRQVDRPMDRQVGRQMTSHCDSHITTDVKPEMIPDFQTGNGIPHDKYNIRGIAHAHTNRKDDIFMQRRLLYIDEAHMVVDIFKNKDIVKNIQGV